MEVANILCCMIIKVQFATFKCKKLKESQYTWKYAAYDN